MPGGHESLNGHKPIDCLPWCDVQEQLREAVTESNRLIARTKVTLEMVDARYRELFGHGPDEGPETDSTDWP